MKKIFTILKLLPRSLYLLFLIGLLLKSSLVKPHIEQFYANIILNFAFFWLFTYFGIIFHEFGHLFFAKIFGGKPKRIILGYANLVTTMKVAGIKIYVKKKLLRGGLAFSTFSDDKKSKIQKLFHHAGGFLTNFILALIFYLIFGYEKHFMGLEQLKSLPNIFITVNFLLGVANLIPYKLKSEGAKQANDGLSFFRVLLNKTGKEENSISENDFFEAFELMEAGKYTEAIIMYEKFIQIHPENPNILLNTSACYIGMGQFDKSYETLKKLELIAGDNEKYGYRHYIYTNLTWSALITDDTENAFKYAQKAFKIANQNMNVMLAYGSVLAFTKQFDEAVKILSKLVDFNYVNFTLQASIVLIYCFDSLNDEQNREKHFDFVRKNINKFSILDKYIYQKVTNLINIS